MSSFKDAITNLRFWILLFTILLYGAAGYPTPDNPGLIELFIGLGLVLSFGLPQIAFLLLVTRKEEPLWMKTGRLLLIYGLSVPLLMAMLNGNDFTSVIRDIFPFLFLLIPFFAYDLFQRISSGQQQLILCSVICAGLLFSVRGLYVLKDGGEAITHLDALYLVNAPTVLFTALYLSGLAVYFISYKRPLFLSSLALLSLVPTAAMGAVLQRASFGALFLNNAFLSTLVLRKSLLRFCLIAACAYVLFLLLGEYALTLLHELFEKNRSVGSNMRFFELLAVWERVADSSLTALFGQGWGGTVQSPAVGDLTVNFTHSLISAALLKTGLIGTILTLSFLGTLFLRFPALYKTSPVLACALFWPFAIDIFLYASYKSLDFGFILMLIACYGVVKAREKSASQKPQNLNDQQGFPADTRGDGTFAA